MSSMSAKLVTGGVLAVIGLITLKVVMFMVGITIGLVALLFKLLPILIIAFLVYKLIKYATRPTTATS